MVGKNWPVREVDEAVLRRVVAETGVSEVLGRLLVLRGVVDRAGAGVWLNPDITHLHPPELLPDFAAGCARLLRALDQAQTVLVWGHDDLDGITATVLLCRTLEALGGRVRYHIPVKGRDRHGLDARCILSGEFCPKADVPEAHFGRVDLVLTVDCGITNHQDVRELKEHGVDVVVTDHHEVIEVDPPAVAVIDPKRPDAGYPFPHLSGVGVALKFMMGVVRARLGFSIPEFLSAQPEALTLAVLGTLADRAPLIGENRALVVLGLPALAKSRLGAVQEVLRVTGFSAERVTVSGFLAELLPLFAAASGNEGVRHFLETDRAVVAEWVQTLVERARVWREEAERSFALASANVRLGDGILFSWHKDLSLRALGTSAARLRDRYRVPAVVLGWRPDVWVGECRGMEGVDLMELLRALRNYFVDYGGHKKAAGFTIADEVLPSFIRAAERYAHENFAPRLAQEEEPVADAVMRFADFDPAVVRLAPFGEGNPQPVFLSEPVSFERRGELLFPATNPRLALNSGGSADRIEPGFTYRVLYTVDDLGNLALVDFQPVDAAVVG